MVQLRDKEAGRDDFVRTGRAIKKLMDKKNAVFMVNDRVDEALELDADGVHLGQEDMTVSEAGKILKNKIIGLSAHSEEQLRAALSTDIDYVSVGPIFPTVTKPGYEPVGIELIKTAGLYADIPFVAIGGINKNNLREVTKAGAKRIAVVRALIDDPDPFGAAKQMIGIINDTDRIR